MVLFKQRQILYCCALAALLLLSRTALAEVVVVAGAKNSSIVLSKNQISDLFLGKVVSLPDGHNAALIDQPETNPVRDEFYSKVANKSAAQAKALWAKLYFTGRGVPPREGTDSGNVKKLVNSTPGAIGYIEQASLDDSVHVIFVAR